jgi:3-oxoacyl-(acyl-carrier-protein) synthase
MVSGQSFISPITRFDTTRFACKVAGTIANFDPREFLDPRTIVQTDRWTHFDLASTKQALVDAQLHIDQEDPTRIGAVFAAGTGGNAYGQRQLHLCWEKGPHSVSAYQSIAWFYAASIGQVSISNNIRGYGRNICAEAAGGLMAFAHAAKVIAHNVCDVVIVGGSEAPVAPYILACHEASGLISTDSSPYRPFDAHRTGSVIGEGGAVFCVESKEHALQRHATIYAEIAGCGHTFDGTYQREPAPDGKEYARAIRLALTSAHMEPSDIDWILCDGLGTQSGDISEVNALQNVFGSDLTSIPASAPKSMIGRLFNGASTVDVATALLGMKNNTLLPTAGYMHPDPLCALDCVPNASRPHHIQQVLVGARGFGGFNAALVLKKPV